MKELDNIIEQATAHITSEYFQLEIDGGIPKYRERVYCYEGRLKVLVARILLLSQTMSNV